MNEQNTYSDASTLSKKTMSQKARQAYSSPRLTQLGRLTLDTMGGGGAGTDFGSEISGP